MADVVLNAFHDKEDNRRLNEPGKFYPREGLEVTEERKQELRDKGFIAKLADTVVEEVEEQEFPMHKGGGHYVLSNGETVKGKEEAQKAEDELKSGE